MRKKMILSTAVLCSAVILVCGQVGIGTATPRGALDINKPTTNTFGLVLPTNSDTDNIVNPQGGNVALATVMYDSSQDCIRVYRSSGWSRCLSDKITRPETVRVAYWSTYAIGSSGLSAFNSQLNNTNNYGASGTYNNVSGFQFTNITSTLANTTADDLLANYDVISTGFSNMSAADAAKIKSYVDRGGVAIISLDNNLGTSLFQAFGGTGNVATGALAGNSTASNTNNGVFGDARNVSLSGAASSGRVQMSQLPAGSKLLANEASANAGVWITGAGGRAIFFWDEGVFRASSVSGTVIDTPQERFLHNIMAYALDRVGS
ncbi:hypothetical protein [Chryseobacterium pennipullorum]|uniref:Uncharacterized protein n=1 Tax=Chryseobacterium pennipullorum TaxID=2258963 RepID=A0A3D9B6L8_9FLAO|nr:hypothetical protein [Chryseobacterium pennipullorum]REC49007.1 hypothetical protein DRF67_05470 [Chryseobacterium pennipullorum]